MSEAENKSGQYELPSEATKTTKDYVTRWLAAIDLASEEEKEWRKDCEEAYEVYESAEDAKTGTAFNIFHANVETISPALYNSTPLPDIRRRFNDRDPAAREVAEMEQRCLSYLIDQYDFDGTIEDSVQDLAVTGRGLARVIYGVELVDQGDGIEDVGAQMITCKPVPWSAFRRGPGRTWQDVPWVAFLHYMDREELLKLSPQYGKQVQLDIAIDGKGDARENDQDKPEGDIWKRALVWEIWDREARMVRFISPGFEDDQLNAYPDPLGLKKFYPIPKPMMLGRKTGQLVPLSPYRVQKPLLEEIDSLTKRIRKLVKQLRPRALGPNDVDIDALANADDGQIVGITNIMQYLDAGGMDKLLAWFPLDPTVKAIEQLYARREQAKQELFEVSGLADIMRGSSNASETLGAQKMKQQWGSLRIQKGQKEIQRFCRDIMEIKAELIAEKYTPQNIAAMSGVQLDSPAIQVMKDQKMRDYRIDIETDSTIRGDLTRNMDAMAQFVQGSAQYFSAIAPIVQSGGMTKQAAVTIYSAFARNFKLGREVDAVLDQLADEAMQADQAGPQQDPAAQAEMAKVQGQMQIETAKLQGQQQLEQAKMQADMPIKQMEMQLKQMDMRLKEMDLQIKQAELQNKRASAVMDIQSQHTNLEVQRQKGAMQLDQMRQQGNMATQKQQADMANQKRMADIKAKQAAQPPKTRN